MALTVGEVIDNKYRVIRLIGTGGMGAVYEAENTRIRRRVAMKIMHANQAATEGAIERFEREAQAAGQIGNDHILEILDLGVLQDGDRYMVMEYLDGETLSERIQRAGRLSPKQLVSLGCQLLAGLEAAHAVGIVHRDLKPDNIFILKEKAGIPDFVKIIDFGISKFQSLSGDGMKMTRTGAVMGTPYYMSPEQARGNPIDLRTDLYAVGVIFYEALTGRVPFQADTFNKLLFEIVLAQPQRPRELVPDLDEAFESIVLKAMAREVEHRFQTAQAMALSLKNWDTRGTPVTVPPDAVDPAADARQSVSAAPELGAATKSTWAASQADAALVPKSKAPLYTALGVAAAVLIGGGLLAVSGVFSSGGGEPAASAGSAAASQTPADDSNTEQAAKVEPAQPTVTPAAPSVESEDEQEDEVDKEPEEEPKQPSSAKAAAQQTPSRPASKGSAPKRTSVSSGTTKRAKQSPPAQAPPRRPAEPAESETPRRRDYGY